MEAYEEGDVLTSPLECMGWVYGRILGDVGGSFVVILDLTWKMVSRLDSGMNFGVGI
jgi:hypothetical protein